MSSPPLKSVQLSLAESAAELAPAIEAAQYARVIQPEEPENAAEAQAIDGFVEDFSVCTETWDQGSSPERLARLGRLNTRIEALERLGLFVHWASVRLGIGTGGAQMPRMPVAILTIGRSSLPSTTVMVPHVVAAADPDPERRH